MRIAVALVVPLVLVLGITLSTSKAEASCGTPNWIGTASGTRVPATGVLFVHDESVAWGDPDLTGNPLSGLTISFESEDAGFASVVRVEGALVRIEYSGRPNTRMTINSGGYDEAHHYELDGEWRPPQSAPRVIQSWHHAYSWTCSSADALAIQIDQPTAAIRARWIYNGRGVDYYEAARVDGTRAVLELGKINCGGTTIPPEQLADGGELELYAIRFDGSEVRISGMDRFVNTNDLAIYEDTLPTAMTIVSALPEIPSLARRATLVPPREHGPWLGVLALVLGGLGLVLAYLLLRRAETRASDCSPASR